MVSPIEYLVSKNFRITSDPTKYSSGKWGLRRYRQKDPHTGRWIEHDQFCDFYHRAYDLSNKEGAPLPAVVDGFIADGTKTQQQGGNFGGTIVLCDHKGDYQYIYGHCKNIRVKVGDEVKQGDILGEQSNTNYYNNYMSSHLHFQVQIQQYYSKEKDFVCMGINPLNINVNDYTSSPPASTVEQSTYTVRKGDTLWSISQRTGMFVQELKEKNDLKSNTINVGQVLKLSGDNLPKIHEVSKGETLWTLSRKYNTTVDKLKEINGLSSNTLAIGDTLVVGQTEKPKKEQKPVVKPFNKYKSRARREDSAYFKGTVKTAEVRKRRGSRKTGFNWDEKAGYDITNGETVFIYEVHEGWGRIYTGSTDPNQRGSNEWIHLDMMNDDITVFE